MNFLDRKINLKHIINMIKKLFWQTLLLLFSATLFLVSTSLFALSLSKPTVGLEQNTERVHQTVIQIEQLDAFELELVVSEATDSGNDSNGFLLYQTSSLNEIKIESLRSKRTVILISPHELGATLIRDMLYNLEKSSTKSIAPGKLPLMIHTKVISVHQSHIGFVVHNWLPRNLKYPQKEFV